MKLIINVANIRSIFKYTTNYLCKFTRHIFHQQCLIKAKAVNPVCPMCRGDIGYNIDCHHSEGMNPYNV